ncbi:hypothetical protein ACOT81_38080 [Streptomyces sp. WI04-05B]|uniref:hypothetical protein n=1 Tax=Streptomyces TaxID=1883 RepID=UPI0029B57F2A|nr:MULTISPECIES: hypothetical protein [unclassified Streptomyces]MDX2545875.1 hypothetical protein [Streptomyces sp. WI04-05B]MDX2586434.1 hypothetical protein [Streptomyces sp. WI04-05A]
MSVPSATDNAPPRTRPKITGFTESAEEPQFSPSYDRHGDANDVLCSSQTDVIEKLRPLVHGPRGEECAAAISPWDVLSVATTAVELTDRHGSDDEDWRAAVERARAYVEVDDAES